MPVSTLVFALVFLQSKIRLVSSQQGLTAICNSPEYLYACTAFDQTLSCDCKADHSTWRLRVSIQITPRMYLWNSSYLGHERLHIDDLRESLSKFVREVESRTFKTREECVQSAEEEKAGFTVLFDRFKEDSNEKRHPFYKRRASHVSIRH